MPRRAQAVEDSDQFTVAERGVKQRAERRFAFGGFGQLGTLEIGTPIDDRILF